jgi:hypothetical protein
MPPAAGEERARAQSVQRLVAYVRANPTALLGLAPEGDDRPDGILGIPPPGVGRLALLLSSFGLPFTPVGIFEEQGCLHLHFGVQFVLSPQTGLDRHAADLTAREEIMYALARVVPERLRGGF